MQEQLSLCKWYQSNPQNLQKEQQKISNLLSVEQNISEPESTKAQLVSLSSYYVNRSRQALRKLLKNNNKTVDF